MTKATLAIIGSIVLATADVHAQNVDVLSGANLNLGIERFAWEETLAGEQLLKEDGVRFTVGLRADTFGRPSPGPIQGFEGRLYFGQVDYDGQTQSANGAFDGLPLQADTAYVGALGEALIGRRFGGRQAIDVLAGVGLNNWVREIQASQTMSGSTLIATDDSVEQYVILYTKLGIGFYRGGPGRYGHLQIGAKYPFYTYEYVDDVDITLEPGKEWSGYAQLRIANDARFDVTIYYDSFRFSQSPAKRFTAGGLEYIGFQPKSHMDVVGLTVGFYL